MTSPSLVESFKRLKINQISCGFDFTTCITEDS